MRKAGGLCRQPPCCPCLDLLGPWTFTSFHHCSLQSWNSRSGLLIPKAMILPPRQARLLELSSRNPVLCLGLGAAVSVECHFIGEDDSCPRLCCSVGTTWKPRALLIPDSSPLSASKRLPAEHGDGLRREKQGGRERKRRIQGSWLTPVTSRATEWTQSSQGTWLKTWVAPGRTKTRVNKGFLKSALCHTRIGSQGEVRIVLSTFKNIKKKPRECSQQGSYGEWDHG